MSSKSIDYPYLHPLGTISYVPGHHEFMQQARAYAQAHSLDDAMPNASAIVLNGQVLAIAANGSDFHKTNPCVRISRNIPTGQGYELCEGCHPKNHSESSVVKKALVQGANLEGAEVYLWGHWWCCEPCWQNMISVGITQVFLVEGSEHLFNKTSPNNMVGRQFEI